MIILPQEIKERFFKTINGDISIEEFEQWLYTDNDLENHLNSNDYLDLISLNFKKSGAKHELWKLLKKHIDLSEFETYKILELLREAQKKTDSLPFILMEFYDLYCRGYNFLQDLGLAIVIAINATADTWEELTSQQQKELLESLSPKLEEYIEEVINWIETKKIILLGSPDEIQYYKYEDLRFNKTQINIIRIN
ncbi:hypothetical protein [Emticicia soli]|uniref:Uncharacterized protein n=1 Tax=Emticicia soli TaxID=2027878 RepID=A0ABW5JDQ3_9BACT